MTIFGGSGKEYVNDGRIEDGALIDGTAIRLTNSESGRIIGGLIFAQGGHTLINELGGIVRVADDASQYSTNAVTGSDGDDTVINRGLIGGIVGLGDGNDRYTTTSSDTIYLGVDLGSGDDRYEFVGTQRAYFSANGGSGRDLFSISTSAQDVFDGSSLSGFEDLAIAGDVQLYHFSGYQTITLGTPVLYGMGFVDSYNPDADVVLGGNGLRLANSSVHSVTGSAAAERFELNGGATVFGAVSLGAGADTLAIYGYSGPSPALPQGGVDGGDGIDVLQIQTEGGLTAYDFEIVTGFERLFVSSYAPDGGDFRITNASAFQEIQVTGNGRLTLSASDLHATNLSGGLGGGITLDSGTVVARYGFPLDGPYDQRKDIQQGDDRQSANFVNRGEVMGEMVFYIGDDRYDGSAGKVGGTVYGNAGNDVLIGGLAAERFEGGYGADELRGNGGADVLIGAAGNDRLFGGDGDDVLDGGAGNDFLDGGAGFESLRYSGLFDTYGARFAGTEMTLASRYGEGTDTLTGIDRVAFKDGVLAFDAGSDAAKIARLYDAALDRGHDGLGLQHWLGALADGQSLSSIAGIFAASPEFAGRFGSLTNQAFVEQLYRFTLGRDGEASGVQAWTEALNGGATRGDVLLGFSESAEHQAQMAPVLAHGLWEGDRTAMQAARMYDAAFDRLPDSGGLSGWVDALKGGLTTTQMASAFIAAPEFQARYGGLSNQAFVEQLYRFCLDREGDAAGVQAWVRALNGGTSRAQLLATFSESAEHQDLTAPLWTDGISLNDGAPAATLVYQQAAHAVPLAPERGSGLVPEPQVYIGNIEYFQMA